MPFRGITAAEVAAPGVLTHVGKVARLVFGEPDRHSSSRAERFLAACKRSGVDTILSNNIAKELWGKFVMLAAFSGVSSVTRMPAGPIMADPDTRKLMTDAVAETAAVTRAKGIDLDANYVAQQTDFFARNVAPDAKASMPLDLENGRRLELDSLSGAMAQFGDDLSVPTPVHHVIYAALKLGRASRVVRSQLYRRLDRVQSSRPVLAPAHSAHNSMPQSVHSLCAD